MNTLNCFDSTYNELSTDELQEINGGLVITIGGVALVLTAKGLAMAGGVISGVYSAGYVIGKGWAHKAN